MEYGDVVAHVDEADVTIIRLLTPFEPRNQYRLENFFHAGSLAFHPEERHRTLTLLAAKPAIVDIFLDRPAVIPEIAEHAAALLASFGASDRALLDIVCGHADRPAPVRTLILDESGLSSALGRSIRF